MEEFMNKNRDLFEEFNKELREQYKKLYTEAGLVYTSDEESEEEEEESEEEESDGGSGSGSESGSGSDSEDELMDIASTAVSNIIKKFYEDRRYKDITNIMFYSMYDTADDLLDFVTNAIIELKLKMPESEVSRWDEIKEYLHKNDECHDMIDIFKHFRKDYKKM